MDRADAAYTLELAVGSIAIHDLTVGEALPGAPVVLAAHGITANGLSWRAVADELYRRRGPGTVRFLAPDLRGRADSRSVPPPYGLAAHVGDLKAISVIFGARPVLVGHSMGAFVAGLAAATAPDAYAGVVLVDGGLAFPPPPGTDIDAALEAVIGPAMQRLSMTFATPEAYLDFWSQHPAVGPLLAGEQATSVRRYLLHDLIESGSGTGDLVSSCVLDAVRADGRDVLADKTAHGAVRAATAAGVAVELVWARRGLMDEPQGLYDAERLASLDLPEAVAVREVEAANHYSVIIEPEGVGAIVDAIDRMLPSDGAAAGPAAPQGRAAAAASRGR
ncbi:MAG: alpha/beta hydrolase [Micrococcales bacterium]|nr:alpha/beta hydrolase [Micrococcales bacterium]